MKYPPPGAPGPFHERTAPTAAAVDKSTCGQENAAVAGVARSRFSESLLREARARVAGHGPPGSRFVPSRGAVELCEAWWGVSHARKGSQEKGSTC